MKEKFVGAWDLVFTKDYRDDVENLKYGPGTIGQIMYSADGRMSAVMMNPVWLDNPERKIHAPGEFMAYAGPWELKGDEVHHTVKIASWKDAVGTVFVRKFELRGENEVFLTTIPLTSKGVVYRQELLWRRAGK